MTSIHSFAEAEKLLANYVPLAKEITGKDITLDRMKPLMDLLGNPHDKLRIIHIAGTSGKTSTSYFISYLLTAAGKKVGLTVSPHVDSVAERIQINGEMLSEKEFASALSEFVTFITNSDIEPTYFELLVAFAYWYFANIGVDYAVIETGIGGLHDGTNIADRPDKLCVITDIGLDHMHVLGNTITEIARQKAGIIHKGNSTLMYRQSDEIMNVFTEYCTQKKASLEIVDEEILQADESLPSNLDTLPEFQKRNWLLAYEAYKFIASRDDLTPFKKEQLTESMVRQVPGRMDIRTINGKTIIMDGAHNEQKMQSFIQSYEHRYPDAKPAVLLSLKRGKEFAAVLPLIKPITSKLIITTFKSTQDLPAESIDPLELAVAARKFGFKDIVTEPDQDKAYGQLLAVPGGHAIITGSFYLLGQLRSKYSELKNA